MLIIMMRIKFLNNKRSTETVLSNFDLLKFINVRKKSFD